YVRGTLEDLAKKKDIQYQLEVLEFGGTDSGAIHVTRGGVPAGVLSIPTRYVHSAIEMAAKNDINSCSKLLVEFLNYNFE
ncbi:MAG TPA: M42 family peptidase, partial [Tissierellaceae bacterium]|nr:M42 family peptidase [Tissierellaceae bacterium]